VQNPAFGRGGSARQVDGHRAQRRRVAVVGCGQQFARGGGSGPGDPYVLQDVVEFAGGDLGVVLGHGQRDLAQVFLDMVQSGAGAQQAGGQGMPGLMWDWAADAEAVDPVPEGTPEDVVADRHTAVWAFHPRREQRHLLSLGAGGCPAVAVFEGRQGLFLALPQGRVDGLGDADGGVEVGDLGLVVPQHRHPAVAAQAFQAQFEDFAAAAAGGDHRHPRLAEAVIGRVVIVGQGAQVRLVGQDTGDVVVERPTLGHHRLPPAGIATMNCRSSPICSATPVSIALRRCTRLWPTS